MQWFQNIYMNTKTMCNKIVIIGGDFHNTLGVIESFGEKGLKSNVIAYTETSWAYVLKSKYVEKGWICHTEQEIISCLINNFSKQKDKAVIIATNDQSASIIDSHFDELNQLFIIPNTTYPGELHKIMSKEYMSSLAHSVGIDVPKMWVINDGIIPVDVEFPCITKAISSVEGSKENIHICKTKGELTEFLNTKAHCHTIVIQKFIDKEFEFQFLGCSLGHGKEIIIPGRTHIDRPNGIDNTYFLKFDKIEDEFSDLVTKIKEFIIKTGYQGTFSVEFLKDKNDGKSYFTEMNFRNDGNAYCVTSAGTNLPYIYYLYNTNGDYKSEIKKSTVSTTYIVPEFYYFKNMLAGEISFKEWRKNMNLATCCTTYFKNDKLPFIWFLLQIVVHGFNRIKRRISRQ